MSGIYRDVYLWSPPLAHLRDFEVKTELDNTFESAELTLNAQVHNYGAEIASVTLETSLLSSDGKTVATAKSEKLTLKPSLDTLVSLQCPIQHPSLWTAETPNRYLALISPQRLQ